MLIELNSASECRIISSRALPRLGVARVPRREKGFKPNARPSLRTTRSLFAFVYNMNIGSDIK